MLCTYSVFAQYAASTLRLRLGVGFVSIGVRVRVSRVGLRDRVRERDGVSLC
jgi:hypothetical protein